MDEVSAPWRIENFLGKRDAPDFFPVIEKIGISLGASFIFFAILFAVAMVFKLCDRVCALARTRLRATCRDDPVPRRKQ